MSGTDYLVDTNILIQLENGNSQVAEFINGKTLFIQFISELELLSKLGLTPTQQKIIEMLLDDCIILDMNREIKKQTIAIKQIHKVKLPDAIIAATAISFDLPLLTSDKGYKKIPELNLSYKLQEIQL